MDATMKLIMILFVKDSKKKAKYIFEFRIAYDKITSISNRACKSPPSLLPLLERFPVHMSIIFFLRI